MNNVREVLSVIGLVLFALGAVAIPFVILGSIYGLIGYVAYKTFVFLLG